jgi:hypothetical protein
MRFFYSCVQLVELAICSGKFEQPEKNDEKG